MAGESVSRILSQTSWQVLPAKSGSDHSSRSWIAPGLEQPTPGVPPALLPARCPSPPVCGTADRVAGRASPPLLFGLAPRGVFRAPGITAGAVGSYPTFSPLLNALDRSRRALGITSGLPQRCKLTSGLFSVALSVAATRAKQAVV